MSRRADSARRPAAPRRQERYRFKRGTTAVLKSRLRKFDVQEEEVSMDTSEASGSG